MPAPLDPVIAQDHSAAAAARSTNDDAAERARGAPRAGGVARRDAAAAGASAGDTQGRRARPASSARGLSQCREDRRRRWCSSTAAAGSRGDLETHDRQARLLGDRDRRGRRLRRLPPPARGALSRRVRGCLCRRARRRSRASPSSAATTTASGSPATAPAAISRRPPRSPAATPASSLAAQLLVYPVTDVVGNFADAGRERALSLARGERRRLFPVARVMEWFCRPLSRRQSCTAPTGASRRCARKISPGVAPAVVTTAWFDPLRDEGAALCRTRCRMPACAVKYHPGEGLIHGYFGLGRSLRGRAAPKRNARARISRRCWRQGVDASSSAVASRPKRSASRDP